MQENFRDMESRPAAQFFSFSIPAILGMLLTSGIVIVDGLFIGKIIGKLGLVSVNLTLPVLYLFLGTAIMIGVGGSVKAGHALGAGREALANRYFSLTIVLAVIIIFYGVPRCYGLQNFPKSGKRPAKFFLTGHLK